MLEAEFAEGAHRRGVQRACLPSGWLLWSWLSVCGLLLSAAVILRLSGHHFAWERPLADIPALWLSGGLIVAGLVYVLLLPLIHRTERHDSAWVRPLLGLILVTGLAMRLTMLSAVPALEDDFYRYLWDGAVLAHGHNPYALAPQSARTDAAPDAIRSLAETGALVLDRVNHPALKTIYPPVAEAAFALAYWIEPWSLRAWRLVCLLGECASLALLLAILGLVGRSPLWVSLYWLNPLVVKELANSAHMEAIVMPFVLSAVLLLACNRPLAASASLGLAIGAKLWPVVLLPLVLRPLLSDPRRLLAALVILGCMGVAWALPPVLGGLDETSGFIAYANHWRSNNALFELLQSATRAALTGSDVPATTPGRLVRLVCAGVVVAVAIWLSRDKPGDPATIVRRAGLIALSMLLLSPAQFPWYATWVLVFTPLMPLAGLLAMTVFMPLYYASFHLSAIGAYNDWNVWLVRLEWLPIAIALAWDARQASMQPLTADLGWNGSSRIRS